MPPGDQFPPGPLDQISAAYWLVMDAVGFLPPPGRQPLFGSPTELARLNAWLHRLMTDPV